VAVDRPDRDALSTWPTKTSASTTSATCPAAPSTDGGHGCESPIATRRGSMGGGGRGWRLPVPGAVTRPEEWER
jgi:hypothetical protein